MDQVSVSAEETGAAVTDSDTAFNHISQQIHFSLPLLTLRLVLDDLGRAF
jgi:hypothetical protein